MQTKVEKDNINRTQKMRLYYNPLFKRIIDFTIAFLQYLSFGYVLPTREHYSNFSTQKEADRLKKFYMDFIPKTGNINVDDNEINPQPNF